MTKAKKPTALCPPSSGTLWITRGALEDGRQGDWRRRRGIWKIQRTPRSFTAERAAGHESVESSSGSFVGLHTCACRACMGMLT
eukprot:7075054-Pyramimonas_sp.AAC.1